MISIERQLEYAADKCRATRKALTDILTFKQYNKFRLEAGLSGQPDNFLNVNIKAITRSKRAIRLYEIAAEATREYNAIKYRAEFKLIQGAA